MKFLKLLRRDSLLVNFGSATNVMVLISAVSYLKKSNNAIFVISSDSEKSHATAAV